MSQPTTADTNPTMGDQPEAPQLPPSEQVLLPMEEIVTHEIVERIVKNTNPDLELIDFKAELGTAAGDNYMSIMYAVAIDVKSRKTGETKTMKIMLKTMPQHALRQKMINDIDAFGKEIKIYEEVFPSFVEFQKKQGVKDEELFTKLPTCYASLTNGKTDYLAMEDLREEGFKLGNRHKGLDFTHCSLVVKNMAKFHAISFAMFQGCFHTLKENYPYLEEKMMLPKDQLPEMSVMFFKQSFQKQADLLRKKGHEAEAKVIEAFARDEFFDEQHRLVGLPTKYAVVGHGDCWTNNFLFKYDEKTGKPTDIKFLDFQISRVSSRALDLGYFLYTSPEISITNDRLEELLKIYYDEFTSFAKKLGYENKELTYDNFVEEFNEHKLYGVVMGLLLAPAISAAKEDVIDMEKMPDEFTDESVEEFMEGWMKSDAVFHKIFNIAKNHAAKIPFIMDYIINNK